MEAPGDKLQVLDHAGTATLSLPPSRWSLARKFVTATLIPMSVCFIVINHHYWNGRFLLEQNVN